MKKKTKNSEVQGEGDYKSARRFNQASREFVQTHDVRKLARDAAPRSAGEAAELKQAEARGKSRAKGTATNVTKSRTAARRHRNRPA